MNEKQSTNVKKKLRNNNFPVVSQSLFISTFYAILKCAEF